MKKLKLLSTCILMAILATLWGCSGDNSATPATSVNQTKTSGKSLVDDLQITKDTVAPFLDQGQPSVAYDTDNNRYMVVWQHITAAGNSEIHGRLYYGTGTGITSAMFPEPGVGEFVINASGGTRQQPKVAYCNDPANPRYLVVWSDSRNGYGQIYGRQFDKDGAALAADFSISTHNVGNTNQIDPDLIYNTVLKKFIVAWVDTTNHDNSNNALNSLAVQGPSCTNSTTVPFIPLPTVDNYLIRSVEVTPFTAATTNIKNWSALISGGPTAYTDNPGTGGSYQTVWTAFSDETRPKLIVSSTDGTYYAAWSGNNYTVTLDGDYTAVPGASSITRNKTGSGVFAAGNVESITQASAISAASITLTDGTAASSATVTGLNTPTITVLIAAGSNLIGQPAFIANLTFSGADTCTYKPVTFTAGAKSGQLITTMKNDGLGLAKFYYFGSVGSTSPGMALDPNTNRMLLVWEDPTQVIKGQLVDLATFSNYGSTISITTSKATSPVVSFDNVNQRFLVAWEDARNQSANISNMDIYAQFIDPQGQLSGGNSIVTVAPGNQLAPALAFGGVNFRQFMVVWKDGRASGNSDIWGQTIEFSQSPQLVVADSTGSPILSGSIDFGNVALGQTKDITLKLRNDGNTQLTINQDPSKTILPVKPYTLLTPMPVTISPGNSYDLIIRFAPTAIGSYAGTSGNKFKLQIDSNGGQSTTYFNGAGTGTDALAITTTALPDGTPSVAYTTTTLTGFGGVYPYQLWSATGLPAGLTLNTSTGVISGTPTTLGTYSVNITLTDKVGTVVTKPLIIKISVVSITTSSLNSGTNGLFYTQTITTTGGVTPFAWTITSGSLPNGLGIDAITGVISGIPTVSGTFNFTVTVTDSTSGTPGTSSKALTIIIQQSFLSITTNSISDMKTNTPVSITLQASGGTLPYTWSQGKGGFPAGVAAFDVNGGNLSGTPTVAGDYSFEIIVTDALGSTATKLYTVSVRDPLNISTATLKSWALNQSGYSDTLTAMGGRGTYTWSLAAGTLPTGLSLNSSTGVISGKPTVAGTYPITIQVADSGAVPEAVSKQFSIIISTAMLIANNSLPVATNNAPYSFTLQSSGGSDPKKWTIQGNPLNNYDVLPGLTLNPNTGVVSGTPTQTGVAEVTFIVTDSSNQTAIKKLSIDVKPAVQITTSTLKQWTQGVGGYSFALTAIGGTAPYKWEWGVEDIVVLSDGSTAYQPGNPPPQGLVLDPFTGIITGTPATITTGSTFNIRLTDVNGATRTKVLSYIINSAMTIAATTLSPATPGIVYQGSLNMNGGTAPFSWSVLSGTLPSGLALDPITGIISGIPTTAGTSQFSIQVTDATGSTKTQALNIAVAPQLAITSSANLPTASLNANYSQTLSASGGRVHYTWSLNSGLLPTGLTLAPATGIVSGKVTAPGTYNFVIQVTDADGRTATQTVTISTSSTTTPPATLSITISSLPAGKVNEAYTTVSLSAAGGTGPRTWSVVSGTLPPGITLAPATGVISGTPTAGGNYDLIVQVTDSDLKSTTQSLSIVVVDASISGGGTVQFTDGTSQITSLGYSNTYKGSSTKKTVTIKNTSSTSVAIASVSSSSTAFYCSGAPFTIAANASAALDVTFTPAQIQAYSGTITLTDTNGSQYQLPVTGSGIGVNVELKSGAGTVSYFNILATTSLPTQNKPADFTIQSAADFQITGVTPGATVTVAVTFATMPANPVFYKIVDNEWKAVTGATISGNTVTFDITDDGEMDSNKTPGIIRDPIVVGTSGDVSGTGDNTPPASGGSSGGGGCFIATAAFGSYLDPHVMVLRHFRDDVLLQSELGTEFVTFYYKHSPPIADFIAQHDMLRTIIRFALTPLIFIVKYPLGSALLFACVCAWFVRRKLAIKQLEMAQQAG